MIQPVLCPRCQRDFYTPLTIVAEQGAGAVGPLPNAPFPAPSRMDDETLVCVWCSHDEAARMDAGEPPIPPEEWPIDTGGTGGVDDFPRPWHEDEPPQR